MRLHNYLLILFGFLSIQLLIGQKIDIRQLKIMAPRNIGPAGMSGRVTTIDVVQSQPDVIYIGTASGGVWKSESGGIAWKPIFDDQPVQAIGALAIQQSNPDVIWVGTGEGNPRNSQNSGEGIFKSLDGGKTWKHMGLTKTKTIHRILIHRDNPDIVYVGVTGSAWGTNPERGVYKTINGGKTWKRVLYVNDGTGCGDLVIDPTNPNKLIAAMWEYGRKPWFFNSGGKHSGIYVTYDGGETWEKRTDKDGLPKGNLGRIGLAIAPSKSNIVYALVEAKVNALYKSTDGGFKWKKVADKNIGNRPFYYADIFVDPKNENRIFNLHSLITLSEDGGRTFKTIAPFNRVHPDHHAFWISPDDPDYVIEGNDGGLNISRDGGRTWQFIQNLPLAQFYHINHDMAIPYNVYGGMQDNGSWIGPSSIWKNGGIRNADWREVYFGDGFDVVPDPDNNRYGYAMSQGGNVGYYDKATGKTLRIKPIHPDGITLRFNWNAAIAQNPFHNSGIYYGSQFVHKSMDKGKTWEIISPDLTTNDPAKQKQEESGGLTLDVTNAENFTTILVIAPSPVKEAVIWAGTDDGNVQITQDGGKNWSNVASNLIGCPKGSWIAQIEVSNKNAGEAFVVVNDYRRNNWQPYVYHTTDYGQTFRRIVDGNKVQGHVWSIVQDPIEPSLLFCGTDYGLYFTIDGGSTWTKWTEKYPSVSTSDLKIHPRDHDLIIGTFGRAAWIMDDIRPLRAIAKTNGKVLDKPFHVFDAPDAYLASYRSVDGVRFAAEGIFKGQNKKRGVSISVWIKPPPPEKKETTSTRKSKRRKSKKKPESQPKPDGKKVKKPSKEVKIQVFDEQGKAIRSTSAKVDTGLNRVTWRLDRKGVRFPSRQTLKPELAKQEPGGLPILPGQYKVIVTYDDYKDSTTVTVYSDPRQKISATALAAQQKMIDNFASIVEKATQSLKQLKSAKKTIQLIQGQMVNLPDSTQKELDKLSKAAESHIDSLMTLFVGPAQTKGIVRFSNTVNRKLFTASSYIRGSTDAPTQTAELALKQAKAKVAETVKSVNAFFEKDWATYQKTIEGISFPLFKAYEAVKVDE